VGDGDGAGRRRGGAGEVRVAAEGSTATNGLWTALNARWQTILPSFRARARRTD
jgi:hypothetical protein